MKKCPCGRLDSYDKCCSVIHNDHSKALTAEDLMRARYTAFTFSDGDFLLKSHHVSKRPTDSIQEIVTWAKSVKWEKLEIIETDKGLSCDFSGTVEFKAFFRKKGRLDFIHEKSLFIKEYGLWYYVESI